MKNFRILIGCEYSGVVRDAFINEGFDATSCDILPTESPGPHIQGDVLDVINDSWDMAIFHPPCTYLAYSGACWLYKDGKKANGLNTERWIKLMEGALFFKKLWEAPIKHIAVENPVMLSYAKKIIGASQTQTIQPYNFGHSMSKRTCLWLKNLPPLAKTDYVEPTYYVDGKPRWDNQTPHGSNAIGIRKDRAKLRSLTPSGIAAAMATQWGKYLRQTYHATK